MSNVYSFEKIDNNNYLKYNGTYTQDGFSFMTYPYFTAIVTSYDDGLYSKAYISSGNFATKYEIVNMLHIFGVKVDLVVEGTGTSTLILPLVSIDADYAYFSNNSLTLKVDSNGVVTEASTNPSEY